MKRTFVFCLLILLLLSLAAGCGSGGNKPAGSPSTSGEKTESTAPQASPSQPADSENTGGGNSSDGSSGGNESSETASSLQAYVDEWIRINDLHEKSINDYEGVVIELPLATLPLSFAPIYEILNIDNKEGRHEGTLLLSGYPAFLEQKGDSFHFGYDAIRDEDGFAPGMKAGDRLLQEGRLDGAKGYLEIASRTEQGGKITEKVKGAYLLTPQSTCSAIYQEARGIDIKGNENKKNTAVFLAMSEKDYSFVIARGQSGTAFTEVELKEGLTVEKAKELFIEAGYTIESSGGIADGKFTIIRE